MKIEDKLVSDNRIKILLIVEAMLGGIRQHVLDIAYGLNKEKYDVSLVYSDNRADERFFEELPKLEKNVQMFRCEHLQRDLNLKEDVNTYIEIKKIIRNIQPDIVHCHSSKAGIVGRIAAHRCRVEKIYYTPNAYSFQNMNLSNIKTRIYIEAEKFLSRRMTTKTINVSQGEMNLALNYNLDKKDKFTLIYNGIGNEVIPDRKSIREKNGFMEDQILIGVTARLAEQKDPMTFLKIAEKVIKQEERVEFIYIGDGELEEVVNAWIKKHKLENRIHMLGFRSDASALVSMLDIYLSTALYEGLPYSMIEAMRAGVPIIATDVVGNNELVVNGVNGLLYAVKDVEGGVSCIMNQINNRVIMQKDVLNTFEQKFSLNIMIKKIDNMFGV